MLCHLLKYFIIVLFVCSSFSVFAEPVEEEQNESYIMNNDRLDTIIRRMDDNPEGRKGYWQFKISSLTITVITDEKADRMRIIIPIAKTKKLDHDYLHRIM